MTSTGYVGLLGILGYQYLESSNFSEPVILPTHLRHVLISFLSHFVGTHELLTFPEIGTDIKQIVQYRIIVIHSLSTFFSVHISVPGLTPENTSTLSLTWAAQNLASDPACLLESYNLHSLGNRPKSGPTDQSDQLICHDIND